MLSILLEELVDDKKQQFVRVSLHPIACPSTPAPLLYHDPVHYVISSQSHLSPWKRLIVNPTRPPLLSVH